MQLRLAFSVAAHLDPEILVIDEVLAVGDATFQKRCIDRMSQLAQSGCTLFFVSHNMEMVPTLCKSALWLRAGQIVDYGEAHTITDAYLASLSAESREEDLNGNYRTGNGNARFRRIQIVNDAGVPVASLKSGLDLRCILEIEAKLPIKAVSIGLVLKTMTGTRLISSWTDEFNFKYNLEKGIQHLECRFEKFPLRPGRQIAFELWLFDGSVLDHIDTARVMDVIEGPSCGFSLRSDQGAVLCNYQWLPA